jgi:polyisoprenoid-binding protein YceI
MRVLDPGISAKERGQIQSTMLGSAVLNSSKYPEITFRSTQVQPAGPDAWNIKGELTLHGETQVVPVQVRAMGVHYVGSSRFKQTEFGIQPVKVAGGMVRVKDEVRIDFDIYLMQ